jgi:hypothetical protein
MTDSGWTVRKMVAGLALAAAGTARVRCLREQHQDPAQRARRTNSAGSGAYNCAGVSCDHQGSQ